MHNLRIYYVLPVARAELANKTQVIIHINIIRNLHHSWCHENGSFSVHSFNQHYLSISQYTSLVCLANPAVFRKTRFYTYILPLHGTPRAR